MLMNQNLHNSSGWKRAFICIFLLPIFALDLDGKLHKATFIKRCLPSLELKNLTVLHRVLTSVLVQHLWDELDCEPDLITSISVGLMTEPAAGSTSDGNNKTRRAEWPGILRRPHTFVYHPILSYYIMRLDTCSHALLNCEQEL